MYKVILKYFFFIALTQSIPEVSAESKNYGSIKFKILGIFFICVTVCRSPTVDIKNIVCNYFMNIHV